MNPCEGLGIKQHRRACWSEEGDELQRLALDSSKRALRRVATGDLKFRV